MKSLLLGLFLMFIAQIGTFIQSNFSAKFNWYEKYPIPVLLLSIPIGWLYIISVSKLIDAFQGNMWPQRIISFGVGIIVFAFMSYYFFREPLTAKTLISLFLAFLILVIQIYF